MTRLHFIELAVQASVFLMIFSIALRASIEDLAFLAHRPGLLVRSLLAMNVIMPVIAIGLVVLFRPPIPVQVALLGLSLAPVPPILPKRETMAGGHESYGISLLATAALFAIVFVPLAAHLVALIFGRILSVPVATVAKIVSVSILVPLVAGVFFRRIAPGAADMLARPLSLLAGLVLAVAAVPVLIGEWRLMLSLVGDFSVLVLALFVACGLGVGHALGGPEPHDRSVLALSTSTRHPAVAIAIGQGLAESPVLLAAVLLAFFVGLVVSVPYIVWRKRGQERARSHLASNRW
jgi:bile acid:Na+ symporter, BASS family